jgi:DinB superfamily
MDSGTKGFTPKTQALVERLASDRQALESAVAGLEAEQSEHRPEEGSWSVSDILHHLALSEEATGKLTTLFLKRAHEEKISPDPDPEGSVVDSIDSVVAGADERRARAPDRVTPRSSIPSSEALARLASSRERLLSNLEALSAFDLTALRFPHPFFGELDGYQWLLVTAWHERRHTRQIERIKRSPGFPAD